MKYRGSSFARVSLASIVVWSCTGFVAAPEGGGGDAPGAGHVAPGDTEAGGGVGAASAGGAAAGARSGSETGAAGLVPVPPRRLRRLSIREYENVVRDLLGDDGRPGARLLEETYPHGFDNGAVALAVQADQAAAFQGLAEALAARAVAAGVAGPTGGCDPARGGEAGCRDAFLAAFPRRAFRRPPTPSEALRLRDVFDAGAAAGGFAMGAQATIEAVLQSPQFLYREELGASPGDARAGRVPLTPFEIASQLSFLLTGSAPDAALFAAAEQGRLATADDVRKEAARLLRTPAARAQMRQLFHQWLATGRVEAVTKDGRLYPAFTPALAASMRRELDGLLDDLLWTGSGSFTELLSSRAAFVDAGLAKLYGAAAVSGPPRRVLLEGAARRGLLTRAGFLAVHAAPEDSAPIARGVFVLEALLCVDLPPPPADVLAQMPPPAPDRTTTTRQRFARHSTEPACAGCHRLIDGVGFGFEQFDALGALRSRENGQPVDTRGELVGTDVDGAFEGVAELEGKLLASRRFADCAARHLHRFALGDVEPAGAAPAITPDRLGPEARVVAAWDGLFESPAFWFR